MKNKFAEQLKSRCLIGIVLQFRHTSNGSDDKLRTDVTAISRFVRVTVQKTVLNNLLLLMKQKQERNK